MHPQWVKLACVTPSNKDFKDQTDKQGILRQNLTIDR